MHNISVCVILLAGGKGTRMQLSTPKQFLQLQNKPLALHSFDLFASLPIVEKLVVVCESAYQFLFNTHLELLFALPGARRQDSLLNGLNLLSGNPLVCIHDAARPFLTE